MVERYFTDTGLSIEIRLTNMGKILASQPRPRLNAHASSQTTHRVDSVQRVVIHVHAQSQLPQVVSAVGDTGGFARLLHRWNEDGHENCYNGDHDQQLDESSPAGDEPSANSWIELLAQLKKKPSHDGSRTNECDPRYEPCMAAWVDGLFRYNASVGRRDHCRLVLDPSRQLVPSRSVSSDIGGIPGQRER
jgi:hypothetical protein